MNKTQLNISPSIRKRNLVVASPSSPVAGTDAVRRGMTNSPQNSWGKGGGGKDRQGRSLLTFQSVVLLYKRT